MRASFRSYLVGFLLSLGLTMTAYLLVVNKLYSQGILLAAIVGLAVVQFLVQLVLFLHLGRESKPRWNMMAFLFMLIVLVIVVLGSLWIMQNIKYNHDHSTPDEVERYIEDEEGIYRQNR